MINLNNAVLTNCVIHVVGNKNREEGLRLSDNEVDLNEVFSTHLLEYFLKPFKSSIETYHFHHDIDIKLNEVFVLCDKIFDEDAFILNSQNIAKHLYNQTKHYSIKAGELFVAQFDEIVFEDVICKGVGIFKSEKKDSFFKVIENKKDVQLIIEKGISKHKMDKGVLILNDDYHTGFKVFSYESNNADAEYWKQDFLSIIPLQDKYKQTDEFINICKEFSSTHVKGNYGKQEQVNFINKSINFISKVGTLDVSKFESEILVDDNDRKKFKQFKQEYLSEHGLELPKKIDIAKDVVQSQRKKIKNEIKLDTKILIKMEGENIDATQSFVEKGYDSRRKMNFYKLYFNEEI